MSFLFFVNRLIFSARANSLVRRIAWLSLTSIVMSVSALLVVLFVMNGMNDNIESRVLSVEPHLVINLQKQTDRNNLKNEKMLADIKSFAKSVQDYEEQDIILRTYDGQFKGIVAKGVTEESLKNLLQAVDDVKKKKETFTLGEKEDYRPEVLPNEDEILIGSDLASSLRVLEGDFVSLITPDSLLAATGETPQLIKVKVSRIIATDLAEIDSKFVFYNLKNRNALLRQSRSIQSGYELWLPDGMQAEKFKNKLSSEYKVVSETWMDRNSSMFFALKLEKLMISLCLSVAGLIAGSSILTVMILLISEKRRDIAILQTIGYSSKKTTALFTKMGFGLAQIAIIIGVIIGVSIGFYIEHNPIVLNQEMYYDPKIPARVSFSLIFFVFLGGGLIAYFGSRIPSRLIGKLNISNSLKIKN